MLAAITPRDNFDPSRWWEEIEARNARIVEEEARQRERERREAAEIEAAKDADR